MCCKLSELQISQETVLIALLHVLLPWIWRINFRYWWNNCNWTWIVIFQLLFYHASSLYMFLLSHTCIICLQFCSTSCLFCAIGFICAGVYKTQKTESICVTFWAIIKEYWWVRGGVPGTYLLHGVAAFNQKLSSSSQIKQNIQ